MAAQDVEIPFPLSGVSKAIAYKQQPPDTTPEAINVIPYDVEDHRFRGGSRPGFRRIPGGNLQGTPLFLLSFPSPPEEGETFRLSFLAGTENNLIVNQTGESVVDGETVYTESFVAIGGILTTEDEVNVDPAYYLSPDGARYVSPNQEAYLQPGTGTAGTGNEILTEDGEPIEIGSASFPPNQSVSATPYQGGVVIPGSGTVLATGTGRLKNGVFIADGITDWESMGVHSLEGLLELTPAGESELLFASYLIRFNYAEQLWVDSGTNEGRCSFRIVEGPKFISAANRSVVPLQAHSGHIPTGATVAATYLDRLVLAKDRIWYMSRQGDPGDWGYGADANDLGRAVAGVSSDAGLPGDPIVAMASRGNDFLIMFGHETTWVMRGDPAAGGVLENLSRTYGIVAANAWCHGDGGEIFFLSKQGFCAIPDGAGARPTLLSNTSLPSELRNVDSNTNSVAMVFDTRYSGVWVFVNPRTGETGSRHWFWSKASNSFWPISFGHPDFSPSAAVVHASSPVANSTVIIGDRTGWLRRAEPGLADDNSLIESSIILGPFASSDNEWNHGILSRLAVSLGTDSDDVTVGVYHGDSAEEAVRRAASGDSPPYSVTVNNLRSMTARPRLRSVAFCLTINSNSPWAFESILATLASAGNARI